MVVTGQPVGVGACMLCALAVCALAEQAGIPAGVVNVVTGDAGDAPFSPRCRRMSTRTRWFSSAPLARG